MNISLVYNVFPGVSGESVFFDSMRRFLVPALRGCDFVVRERPIAHLKTPILSTFEFYSRFPLLASARAALGRCRDDDLVHFLNSSLAPSGWGLKKPRKVATVHLLGDSYRKLPPPEPFAGRLAGAAFSIYSNMLDRGAMRSMDAVAACTPFQARDLADTHSLDETKVSVIPPGIDSDYFRKVRPRDLRSEHGCERVFAYVGRLHERSKGVSYAIRAMEHLAPDSKLLIVGDGPDRRGYEALARKLGLGARVIFMGVLGTEEKSVIQKSADACVIPSLRDVFCTVFAESLACGVPVAAFSSPFWNGLYDGAAEFAGRSPEALAFAMEKALARRTVRRGLELAAKYDVKNTVAAYVSLYERLVR